LFPAVDGIWRNLNEQETLSSSRYAREHLTLSFVHCPPIAKFYDNKELKQCAFPIKFSYCPLYHALTSHTRQKDCFMIEPQR